MEKSSGLFHLTLCLWGHRSPRHPTCFIPSIQRDGQFFIPQRAILLTWNSVKEWGLWLFKTNSRCIAVQNHNEENHRKCSYSRASNASHPSLLMPTRRTKVVKINYIWKGRCHSRLFSLAECFVILYIIKNSLWNSKHLLSLSSLQNDR